jgi:D-alanyl-D-alanine carboxypeptidase/Putative peptidoglycan binding domain
LCYIACIIFGYPLKGKDMSNPRDILNFANMPGLDRRTINGSLTGARNITMQALIGMPRGSFGEDCRPVQDTRIAALMTTADVGPFRVTGLQPAVTALTAIMAEVKTAHREVYDQLGTAGMLCCRLVRGSATSISNHSWGTAVDLTIDGVLDPRGDGKTQRGLLDIHPVFNAHGFFWGAAFPTEDSMHFEASEQLIRKWAADGQFGPVARGMPQGLTIGDRGAQVEALQAALNRVLAPLVIEADGIFGKDTRGAVIELQRRGSLPPDGIAGEKVQAFLGLA